jgi:hypothetical protein
MKYIIFKSPDGLRIAIFPAPTTHAEEAMLHREWSPISAGYVEFLGGGRVRTFGRSDSLNLDRLPRDADFIECFMSATLRLATPVSA